MHLRYSFLWAILVLLSTSTACDKNEYSPEIADQMFMIDEHSKAGSIVGTIQAFDQDEGQKLSFEILDGNQAGAFSLDARSGILIVEYSDALDFETNPDFLLHVRVSDNHSDEALDASASVSIHLQNLYEWTTDLHGLVQKGPFISGSQLNVFELNENMEQTGRVFSTLINDNLGGYSIPEVELNSPYVLIRANGFYFNECAGQISSAQMNLQSLVDIREVSSTNINVISNLESDRKMALIRNGMSFSEASTQTLGEVLRIFELEEMQVDPSAVLDISRAGNGNEVLLAISLILQGYTSTGEMAELIALISRDIREDGTLDNGELGSMLINNARHIKLPEIRNHIEERYNSLGVETNLPYFEEKIDHFIRNSGFEFTGGVHYPASGAFGRNILDTTNNELFDLGWYSMSAEIPEDTDIRVKLSSEANLDFDYNLPNTGWAMQNWNLDFVNTRIGEIDGKVWLGWVGVDLVPVGDTLGYPEVGPYEVNIEVFENDNLVPTWTHSITVKDGTPPMNLH